MTATHSGSLAGPPLHSPQDRSGTVVALDVGATRIKAALVAPDGNRHAEIVRPTRRTDGPEAVLRRVGDAAAELLGLADSGHVPSLSAGGVRVGGVAVCGTVDRAGRVSAVNLGWDRADVGSILSDRLGIEVAVVNDAHAGAIGEGTFGAARGVRDYLYVSLGTGIGAAIVQDGRVVDGAHGNAGELGHIKVDRPGRLCACGSRGCLETIVSAAAIENRWLEIHGEPLTARKIVDRVIVRDPAATTLWETAVDALATGLLTVMSLLDPATIVLGGGLIGAGTQLVEPLARSIKAQARSFHDVAELRLASLGDWSGCAGAAVEARARIALPARRLLAVLPRRVKLDHRDGMLDPHPCRG